VGFQGGKLLGCAAFALTWALCTFVHNCSPDGPRERTHWPLDDHVTCLDTEKGPILLFALATLGGLVHRSIVFPSSHIAFTECAVHSHQEKPDSSIGSQLFQLIAKRDNPSIP
jgi:hypothetical protein